MRLIFSRLVKKLVSELDFSFRHIDGKNRAS
jgi:hypothetical protein